jgi:hypothetical protein
MRGRRRGALVGCLVVVAMLSACSDDGATDESGDTSASVTSTTTTAPDRPDGPAATLSEEITGGNGIFIGAPDRQDDEGYVEEEYVAAGTAMSYRAAADLTPDGKWALEPAGEAEYRTRIVVRRPENDEDFSGTVLVEWLNVSGGVDADPDYTTLREEIVRQGHMWVGVSAQVIGVEGGPVAVRVDVPGAEDAGKGLKAVDPERYGSLQHPGDAYAYDIFTQVARGLREDSPALGDLEPTKVVAVGESQSAFALVTYINGVQPLTHAFDGFFVHSRGAAGLALPAAGQSADIASSIGGGTTAIFRDDTDVPIFDLQTESDISSVLNSAAARQPDSDTFRLWEVPGTAHADLHLVGESTASAIDCGVPINDGPLHVVAKAAFRHFVTWVEGGDPPPEAPRIELAAGGAPTIQRDADGIALGGLRTPPVDVPVRVLSGEQGPNDEVICLLFGSTKPLPAERLAALYPSRADYEERYGEAVDKVIDDGYVLDEDRDALESFAHPELVSG